MQVAENRRRVVEVVTKAQRVLRREVEPGQPDAGLRFAALSQSLGEQVQLAEGGVETEPQQREPALHLGGRGSAPGPADPADELQNLPAQPVQAVDQIALDGQHRPRQRHHRRHHGLLQRERLDPIEPSQQRAGLLFEQPGRKAGGVHGGQIPNSTIRRPRRTQRPLVGRP